jgi:hypothetical protein
MRGFLSPTVNDFLSQLHMQSERLLRDFHDKKNGIDAQSGKIGTAGGSRHILLITDAVERHIEKGVAILLGELRRALEYPELNPQELRDLIGPRLIEFVDSIISASQISTRLSRVQNENFKSAVNRRLQTAKSNVTFWLRQFDIGWDDPVVPETLITPPS